METTKTSKKGTRRAAKVWKSLFRPKCFGDRKEATKCLRNAHRPSSKWNDPYPCRHYEQCIDECIRKIEIEEDLEERKNYRRN